MDKFWGKALNGVRPLVSVPSLLGQRMGETKRRPQPMKTSQHQQEVAEVHPIPVETVDLRGFGSSSSSSSSSQQVAGPPPPPPPLPPPHLLPSHTLDHLSSSSSSSLPPPQSHTHHHTYIPHSHHPTFQTHTSLAHLHHHPFSHLPIPVPGPVPPPPPPPPLHHVGRPSPAEDDEEDDEDDDDLAYFAEVTPQTPRVPPAPFRTFSNETPPEVNEEEEEEATLRELLVSGGCIDYGLQKQVAVMSMNLSSKLDELQGERHLETSVALSEIRTQLQELTKSVESCQSEVTEVKRNMVDIRHELDVVQHVKDEIEELRECVDRLEEQSRRRKLHLLEQGLTCFLSYAIFAAVLGMLQFGYNTGVINAPEANIEKFMKDVYQDRYGDVNDDSINYLYSIAVSIFAIGGMLGGFSGALVANRFGRKGGLLINNVLGIGGACLMGFTKMSNSYEMLILGRFVIGVNCGLNTSLVPMYVSEIAPLNLRGGLGTVNQLAVTVGLLLAQILGIDQLLGTDEGWPLLLGLAICPAILQLVLLPACPESPRYLLMTKQWEEEARKALRRLRSSNHVEEDIEEMRAEERAQAAEMKISMLELLRSRSLRAPLVIGVVMQLSQQLSGINAVFYYSTTLFTSAGLSDQSAKYATIGIGAIMVIMTLISIPLMDRAGRRTLHLYGLGGMFIFSILITISMLLKQFFQLFQEMVGWMTYLAVVSTLCFVMFFALGPGSIPWMITAELFSQGPRPAAMSISSLINWLAGFIVGLGFPIMRVPLDNYSFLPFSLFLAVFWVFTYKKVPETKNKTFEEISALFRERNERGTAEESRLYGSMLNCVNALGQPLQPEHSALIAEEKPHPESSASERSSQRETSPPAPPPPPPPPPVPFMPAYSLPLYQDNAV